jgi:hypothetical protein
LTIIRGAGPDDAVVAILRSAAQDPNLSYRARGILVAVMSRPVEWKTDGKRLSREGKEGEQAVYAALRELAQRGYLRRTRTRRTTGHVVTDWVISDDPAHVLTGSRLPRTGEPRTGEPRTGKPRTGKPRTGKPGTGEPGTGEPPFLEEGEREGDKPPPPTPAGALPVFPDPDPLIGVVVGVLQRTKTPVPASVGLRRECSRLAQLQWTAAQLQAAVEGHDWSGARAGAVITFLRQLQAPSAAHERGLERPAWCGACDEATRTVDGPPSGPRNYPSVIPCPTCHPKSRKDPA